ncbi:MAG: hypothetical protein AAB668_02580 [Patescibacteria group bacterium]
MSQIEPRKSTEEVIIRGNEIYDQLQRDLEIEASQLGKHVAIEVDSKEYFFGDTRDAAVKEARQKFPDKILFVRKIGSLEKVARNHPSSSSIGLKYARVF